MNAQLVFIVLRKYRRLIVQIVRREDAARKLDVLLEGELGAGQQAHGKLAVVLGLLRSKAGGARREPLGDELVGSLGGPRGDGLKAIIANGTYSSVEG
jgi:hypothetical protein